MSKKINTSGPSSGFIADPTVTPFPINWNRLNKIRFEDAPTDYILLCKLTEKYNEIVEATNSLEEAMEQFMEWTNATLEETTINQLKTWLEDGTLESIIEKGLLKYKVYFTSDYCKADGNTDNTADLQKAINESEGFTLVFDAQSQPYRSSQLLLKSDTRYIFEQNTVIKANDAWISPDLWQSAVIMLDEVTNVEIYGNGAKITQNRPTIPTTEHANCVGFVGCTNVYAESLVCENANGDGIYIDNHNGGKDLNNLRLYNFVCNNCGRNGGSINGGSNILICECTFKNTNGIAPQAGFDVEPLARNLTCENITFENCIFENNQTAGIKVTGYENTTGYNFYVKVIGCKSTENQYGFVVNNLMQSSGLIEYINCYSLKNRYCGVLDSDNDDSVNRIYNNIVSEGCNTNNQGQDDSTATDGSGWGCDFYVGNNKDITNSGNVTFENCKSKSPLAKSAFGVVSYPKSDTIHFVRILNCTCDEDIVNFNMRTTSNNSAEDFTITDTLKRQEYTGAMDCDHTFTICRGGGYFRNALTGVKVKYRSDTGNTISNDAFAINGTIKSYTCSGVGYLEIEPLTKTSGYIISNYNYE